MATKKQSALTVNGFRILDNVLVIDYKNEKGEWKKTYSFNCKSEHQKRFGELLRDRLEMWNAEYVMSEAKKLCEKGLLINIKELKDNIEDEMEQLV